MTPKWQGGLSTSSALPSLLELLPPAYDGLSLLTFKPELKSSGLSGTCRGRALEPESPRFAIEMPVCLPLLPLETGLRFETLSLPFLSLLG